MRTAIGVAVLAFYFVLFLAGGNDVIAAHFDLSVNAVTYVFRALLFVLPVVAALVTYRLCKELTARDRHREEKLALLERTAEGGYVDAEDADADREASRSPIARRDAPTGPAARVGQRLAAQRSCRTRDVAEDRRTKPRRRPSRARRRTRSRSRTPRRSARPRTARSSCIGNTPTGPAPSAIVASESSSGRTSAWRDSNQIEPPATRPISALAASITEPASSYDVNQ